MSTIEEKLVSEYRGKLVADTAPLIGIFRRVIQEAFEAGRTEERNELIKRIEEMPYELDAHGYERLVSQDDLLNSLRGEGNITHEMDEQVLGYLREGGEKVGSWKKENLEQAAREGASEIQRHRPQEEGKDGLKMGVPGRTLGIGDKFDSPCFGGKCTSIVDVAVKKMRPNRCEYHTWYFDDEDLTPPEL